MMQTTGISIHWDLVNIQKPGYGGGEIWFDDVLIRKKWTFYFTRVIQIK